MVEKAQKLLTHKDKEVRELAQEYINIQKKPEYPGFVALQGQYNNWLKQYTEKQINLFEVAEKPVFEVAHKFFTEIELYISVLNKLKSKLTEEEKQEAQEAVGAFERSLQRNGILDA